MERIKIHKVQLKNDGICVYLNCLTEQKEFLLSDQNTGNQMQVEKIEEENGLTKVSFSVRPSVESLGQFELLVRNQDAMETVLAEESCYEELSLNQYAYHQEADLYIRCQKNEEGNLVFTISRARKIKKKQTVQVHEIKSSINCLELYLQDDVIESGDDYRFFVVPAKQAGMWIQPCSYDRKEKHLTIDMSGFAKVAESQEKSSDKWRMYLEVLHKGEYRIFRIGCETQMQLFEKKSEDFYDFREICKDPLHTYVKDNVFYEVYPYFTENGNVALVKNPQKQKYELALMNKVLDLQIRRGILKIVVQAHKTEMKITGIMLTLRTKQLGEEQSYQFPVQVKEEAKSCRVTCEADLTKLEIRPLYWDIRLVYEKDGVEYATRMTNHDSKFYKKYFMSFFSKNTMKLQSGELFYPYMTVTGLIAFQCREQGKYDGYGFKIKERVAAFLYFVLKRYWIKKNIYLVFEKFCVMAQDNGYYFFQYCMENDMERKLNRRIYYVMDRKSPDWDKVAQYKDHVIPFMSLKHIVYLLASKLLISTDTRDHAYAWRTKDSILAQYLDSKKLVFLQHGVIALKQVHFLYSNDRRGRCSLFITSNDTERDIIYNFFGYKKKQIAVTGLARWDVLEDRSEGRKEILMMPTWRNWLDEVGDDLFKESDYYKNYMSFLNSEKLSRLLEKYDLKLNFYLHPKFREYIGDFKINGERIRLIPFGEEPLNELMMKCKLLVTDYSSVCWDVFYQSKPVIFYQFDMDQYNQAHGSYIDLETELFGDRVEKQEDLIDLLEEYAGTEFTLKEKYAKMQDKCYKYIDKQNSQRICDEIIKRGW